MAGSLSMDDKLLGEKTHYYCSSSEESDGDEEDGDQQQQLSGATPPEVTDYSGHCTNTGPKGVIQDWRRFKQLETEKRGEAEREKLELMKKLSISCRSYLNEEEEKDKDEKFLESLDEDLLEDDFLKEYRERRLEEMRRAFESIPKFGKVYSLTKAQFAEEIDKEKPQVTVVVLLYEDSSQGCDAMNGCLMCLAKEYPTVKFCKIRASDAKMSLNFVANGVPALLIYKAGELIGRFIRLTDEFGEDFFATDIESFLKEHGYLPEMVTSSIMGVKQENNSDSDFEID